jgi:translocation and assembly module TamA
MALSAAALLLAAGLSTPAAGATAEVRIEGLDGELLANVRARLGIRNAAQGGSQPRYMLERMHERAPDDIRGALQPFGYYNPIIEAELESLDEERLRATYRVEAGPRTYIEELRVGFKGEGAKDRRLRRELAKLDMHEGQPLRHERYGRAKERLSRAAFGLGYFDTSYESAEIRVTPSTNSAAVALVLDTGPSYSVGAISIDQHTLDDDVLRRYLPIHEGEPFAPDKLLDTQFQLMDLGYFSRVDVHPMREEAEEGRMPIRIAPEYLPSQRYSTGIGYGTDTGARLSLKTELRRINRRGHWIDSDIRLAERRSNAGISYNIPLGDVPGERLSFTGTYSDERFEDGTSERYELGVSLSRQPGSWRRRTYLEYSSERFNVGDLRRTTDLLVPGVSFERSESDDPIYPRNGWRVFFDVHGAGEPVLSSTSFAQTRVATNGILPLWDKARLLGRFEYGASFVDSFERLPLSERFYAGGDQSVRGYAYQSLGERDAEGNVIGGRYLATMSAEAEYLFWGNTGAAIFMDAGGAANKSFPELSRSVGVGVRYRSPIGSLRLDLAHPLDATRSVRLHIGIRVGL